jgi:hypothetical protein
VASKYLPVIKEVSIISEPVWKRKLIEHDIKLQNVKMEMMELKYENLRAEM